MRWIVGKIDIVSSTKANDVEARTLQRS